MLWLLVLVEPTCLAQEPLSLVLCRLAEVHRLLDILFMYLLYFISHLLCGVANDEAFEVLQAIRDQFLLVRSLEAADCLFPFKDLDQVWRLLIKIADPLRHRQYFGIQHGLRPGIGFLLRPILLRSFATVGLIFGTAAVLWEIRLRIDGLYILIHVLALMSLSFSLYLALNNLVLVDSEVSLVAHPLIGLVVYVVAVLVLS